MTQALEPGLEGSVGMTVGPADLASALGSGDVAVLGTPRLVALAEAATVAALAGVLDPGRTSVGTRVDLRHLAPTVEGRPVRATARLVTVDGRALGFVVEVSDDQGRIGEGTVERAVVDRTRFEDRARQPR